MVRPCSCILIDDNFRTIFCIPIIYFPCFNIVPLSKKRCHLFFDTNGIGTNPHRKANHSGLVHYIVIETWTYVDSHRPNFLILWITIVINRRIGVTIRLSASVVVPTRSTTSTWPVYTSHIEINIIRNLYVWIIFFDPFISPVITTSFSTFFTRPQTEYHCVPSTEISHCFCNCQDHTRSGCVVIRTYSCTIRSSNSRKMR